MFWRKKLTEQEREEKEKSYWSYVKRQYKKNKRALFSLYVIMFLGVIAIFADFLANEKPILASYEGTISSPVLKSYAVGLGLGQWPVHFQNVDWKKDVNYDWVVFPPIPYYPSNLDFECNFCSPTGEQPGKTTRFRHWLGTDDLGRDVTAGMIHGTRIAFMVGIVAMGIACFIGIFLGSFAGFFGDTEFKISRIRLVLTLITAFFAFFYGFFARSYLIADAIMESSLSFMMTMLTSIGIFVGIIALVNLLVVPPLKKIPFLGKQVTIPLDIILTRMIEVIVSIPTLVLILAVVAIVEPSIIWVMIIIGLVGWTGIARFIRAELLRVRHLEYIEASTALGFSRFRAMVKHAIPNALSPVLIAIAFGVAGAILTESILSFLGIGVPTEVITWGKLLSLARTAPQAWWLAIFPGFAIFITVTMFNLIGEGLTDALDPRLKQ